MKQFKGPDPKVKARGPKKSGRKVDKQATKRAVLAERSCGICGEPSATGHHVLSRKQGGDDVPQNIVALCGSGNSGCHGLVEANNVTARRQLGEHLVLARRDVISYVQDKLGETAGDDWLARRLFIV